MLKLIKELLELLMRTISLGMNNKPLPRRRKVVINP